MEQIEMDGIDTADKKREIRTIRLMEKLYSEELQQLKSSDPTSRRSLIEQLLKRAKNSGISDSMIMSSSNRILESLGLPVLTEGKFDYLTVNGSIGNCHADISVIIGINQLFKKFGEHEQYSDVPLRREHSAFAVPPIFTELSNNEQEAIQKGNIEKMKERVLYDFFREYSEEWSVVQNAINSIDTIAEFINNKGHFSIAKLYENYGILYSKFEHFLLQYGGVVKPHGKLSLDRFERAVDLLKSGDGFNVPMEIRLFVVSAFR